MKLKIDEYNAVWTNLEQHRCKTLGLEGRPLPSTFLSGYGEPENTKDTLSERVRRQLDFYLRRNYEIKFLIGIVGSLGTTTTQS